MLLISSLCGNYKWCQLFLEHILLDIQQIVLLQKPCVLIDTLETFSKYKLWDCLQHNVDFTAFKTAIRILKLSCKYIFEHILLNILSKYSFNSIYI